MIRNAGVVGAGGAGFPAHVKAGSNVDCVIANGAECEPLIHKDYELMVHHAGEIVRGVRIMMEATGAKEGIIGIKQKNQKAIEAFQAAITDEAIRLHFLGDFYPSGDEYILVYEATGRLIPPQGIPLNIGVVVNNVETLYNISQAVDGIPVTDKFITVAGAVRHPVTCRVPVGLSYRQAIELAGGATVRDFAIFVSGIMMGKLETDLDQPITKTCAGLIILPTEHTLVQRKSLPEDAMHRIGKSACDQCSYCTELCPRYILGYDVQPHKVMRSLGFTQSGEDLWNQFSVLCCSCGLCTLYACPEALFPKEACDRSKAALKQAGIPWSGKMDVTPHPMYEGRRTPLKQLIKRLGISEYDVHTEFSRVDVQPDAVRISLSQHVGTPATARVRVGERVRKGQCIADVSADKLGASIHASMDGIVERVDTHILIKSGVRSQESGVRNSH
jgi:Na+-translocating ferredoxin:NAD+ oxidoreductase RnfC subunit